MYVTDTPVMDRITDTPRWETRVALDALEEALCDVQCAAEDTFGVLIDVEQGETPSTTGPEARKYLSDAVSAVLSASEGVTEALGRLGIEAL